MTKDKGYWKQVLDKAKEQLASVREERSKLEKQRHILSNEIIRLEQLIASLAPLATVSPSVNTQTFAVGAAAEMGLADACREVLKVAEKYKTARGIRDALEAGGYDLEQHRNPLASVHGVLKRLEESGEADRMESNGKTFYCWIGERRTLPMVRVEMAAPTITSKPSVRRAEKSSTRDEE